MIILRQLLRYFAELLLAPALILIAVLCRFSKKRIDVGLGPEPLINNVYHKMALEQYGYSAQTFVIDVYFITDRFDVRGDKLFFSKYGFFGKSLKCFTCLYVFILSISRYKCLFIYFSGGVLGLTTSLLWRIEPFLYKLAGVKVVVMPYGKDVQELSRSSNLLYKHAMACDYPEHRYHRTCITSKIDLWTKYADHVIGGCEWVTYMYHWDTLMLAHFSIDVASWEPVNADNDDMPHRPTNTKLRILHAPNHRTIKGTQYFIDAVNELVHEGLDIELVLLEGVPNDELKSIMASVDVVADQLIVGWYAMFAIEGMAMGKPVLCFLDENLKYFYEASGLVGPDELPIIDCSPLTVKETIRDLYSNRHTLENMGKQSRDYVIRHHSTEAVGKVFDEINRSIGVKPSTESTES